MSNHILKCVWLIVGRNLDYCGLDPIKLGKYFPGWVGPQKVSLNNSQHSPAKAEVGADLGNNAN